MHLTFKWLTPLLGRHQSKQLDLDLDYVVMFIALVPKFSIETPFSTRKNLLH